MANGIGESYNRATAYLTAAQQDILETAKGVAVLGIAGYLAYHNFQLARSDISHLVALKQAPKVLHPIVCRFIRTARSNNIPTALLNLLPSVIFLDHINMLSGVFFCFSIFNFGSAIAYRLFERKFCGPDNFDPSNEDPALQVQLEHLVIEWSAGPAQSRFHWPASARGYAADDVAGNMLPGLILGVGGLLAAGARGAASGLSWTAESAMGAVPRLPAFGY